MVWNFCSFCGGRVFEVSGSGSGSVGACGAAVEDVQRAASALHALCGILSEVTLKSWPFRLAVTTPSMAAVTTPCYAAVTSGCCDDHSDLRRDAVIAAFRVELTR